MHFIEKTKLRSAIPQGQMSKIQISVVYKLAGTDFINLFYIIFASYVYICAGVLSFSVTWTRLLVGKLTSEAMR